MLSLSFVWNSASMLMTLVGGLIGSLIVARYLGPEAFGLFGLVQWTRITAAMLLDIGLSSATTRFTAEFGASRGVVKPRQLGRTLLWFQILIAVPAGLILASLASTIANVLGQPAVGVYLPIAAITLALTLINGVLTAYLVGQRRFGAKAAVDTSVAVLTLTGVVFVVLNDFGISGLLWTEALAAAGQFALLGALSLDVAIAMPSLRLPPFLAGRLLRYAAGVFVLTGFDAVVWQRSEVFFLAHFRGPEEIAYFTIAYSFAVTSVTLLPHSLGVVLFPSLSERSGADDRSGLASLYEASTRHAALVAFPLCAGGIVLAPQLVHVLYGTSFDPATGVLRILFIGAGLGALATPGSGLFLALEKAGVRSLMGFPMIILNVVLAILLVPLFGAFGAAIVKSLTQAAHVAVDACYLVMRERFRIDWPGLLRIAFASAAPAAAAYAVTTVFDGIEGLVLAVLLGAVAYVFALGVLHAVPDSDLNDILRVLRSARLVTIAQGTDADSAHK